MGTAAKNLKKARKVRRQMASQMRALETGKIRIEDVLRDPPNALGRCSIYVVLYRTPHLGKDGAKKLCTRFKMWPEDRLASFSLEQRTNLIGALPERVRKP